MKEMYELYKLEKPVFKRASEFVSKEYLKLMPDLALYAKLFVAKYRRFTTNVDLLCGEVGCSADELVLLQRNLDAYLASAMGGSVRGDLLELVCPNCLRLTLTDRSRDGEEIKRTCTECGEEADESYSDCDDYDQSLDWAVTFAPTSQLSWTSGQGCTLDMKKHGHKLLHDPSVPFAEFKASNPAVASALLKAVVVTTEEFAYHLMCNGRDVVRKVPVEEFFRDSIGVFTKFDLPLRRQKASMASSTQNEYSKSLAYGMLLCNSCDVSGNQAFMNSLGNEIRSAKRLLKLLKTYRVSERVMVDSLFYFLLLRFERNDLAAVVKSSLKVDVGFINLMVDFKDFLQSHKKKVNSSPALLEVLERNP